MSTNRVKIQGLGIDNCSLDEAVDFAYTHGGQVVTINPEMIYYAKKNPYFSDIISSAELVIPDGIGVEIGLKILGHKVKRIPGIELGKELIIKFSNNNKTVALIGAKPEVLKTAVKNLLSEIDNLNIVYAQHGYYEDEDEVIASLSNVNPDLILVALGSPKQELFINKLKTKLPKSAMIGLGGSFDVWSGTVKRAPKIYQVLGLEWLYRTIKEPKRFKRIFPTLPLFILKVFKERLFGN
jgi:N-acetylglucosaminyldiphosphoundecaprenol N-acetyl-beta-D-mannosaminyltransferase